VPTMATVRSETVILIYLPNVVPCLLNLNIQLRL
jgi:hypothetical protein